jgi:hypothetical protein
MATGLTSVKFNFMQPSQPKKPGEKPGELTQLERVAEVFLLLLTGGLLLFIFLWIVWLA